MFLGVSLSYFKLPYMLLLLSRFSRVRLCVTPETAANQASPSLGFSRQEHWSRLLFPSPGDLPDPRIKPMSPAAPAWQADSLSLCHLGSLEKAIIIKDTCTTTFIATLLTTARIWKQPKCPLTDEGTKM